MAWRPKTWICSAIALTILLSPALTSEFLSPQDWSLSQLTRSQLPWQCFDFNDFFAFETEPEEDEEKLASTAHSDHLDDKLLASIARHAYRLVLSSSDALIAPARAPPTA